MKIRNTRVLRTVALVALASCLAMGLTLALANDEGSKERAWLGVVLSQENDGPIEIIRVVEGSPAEAAGIQKGDKILRIDGAEVENSSAVVGAVRGKLPGDSITLEVEGQDGSVRSHSAVLEGRKARAYAFSFNGEDFNVDLGNLEESMSGLRERLAELHGEDGFKWMESGEPQGYLGVGLIQPSDDLRKALGALEGEGVLIDKVVEESPAAEAGLQAGDFVVSVDGEAVASTGQLTQLIRSREPGTSVSLGIIRDRAPMNVSVTLGESKNRFFIFRGHGEGEGPHGFNFGPHEMRFFDGPALEEFELDLGDLNQTIQDALGNIHIDVHEDDDSGPEIKKEILIGPRVGSVDA